MKNIILCNEVDIRSENIVIKVEEKTNVAKEVKTRHIIRRHCAQVEGRSKITKIRNYCALYRIFPNFDNFCKGLNKYFDESKFFNSLKNQLISCKQKFSDEITLIFMF